MLYKQQISKLVRVLSTCQLHTCFRIVSCVDVMVQIVTISKILNIYGRFPHLFGLLHQCHILHYCTITLCPSGKNYCTQGTFQLVFEFFQHHANDVFTLGIAIVSISKNTISIVFFTIVWVIAPILVCCNCVHLKKSTKHMVHGIVHNCLD